MQHFRLTRRANSDIHVGWAQGRFGHGASGMRVYDPLSYENLAASVVRALMEMEAVGLPPAKPFGGSGVYAIYYHGSFSPYKRIAGTSCEQPIYVGKAIPAGGRKAKEGLAMSGGSPLFRRLKEHAKSIEQAKNLALSDFKCRYLVVVPVWITLAERFLVSHYQPLWNVGIDGFGDHDPGKGRRNMRRPLWDSVHPGRPWAGRLKSTLSHQEALDLVEAFFNRKNKQPG